MLVFDEALAIVAGVARPPGRETISLDVAFDRTLAAPVVAQTDAPPANVSAMDGYAVREADLASGAPLRLVGVSWPGAAYAEALAPGVCVRIFTGATVPEGADRVIVQEIARPDGEHVHIAPEWSKGRHIRLAGSDFKRGDVLLPAGRILEARAIVAAAAADISAVEVWRRPRISILGTGDELAEPGRARETPGSIPDSLSRGIAAFALQWGGSVIGRVRLRDDPAELREAATTALAAADLVIMTGGASVGERDYAKSSFAAAGTELLFSGVAIKPGKPVWLGRAGDRLVLGLPGNPASALVTARLLLAPLLAGLGGRNAADAVRWRQAPLTGALPPCGDRETFVRGRRDGNGVEPLANQDSGAQKTLAEADLLIRRRPHAPGARPGEQVDVLDF